MLYLVVSEGSHRRNLRSAPGPSGSHHACGPNCLAVGLYPTPHALATSLQLVSHRSCLWGSGWGWNPKRGMEPAPRPWKHCRESAPSLCKACGDGCTATSPGTRVPTGCHQAAGSWSRACSASLSPCPDERQVHPQPWTRQHRGPHASLPRPAPENGTPSWRQFLGPIVVGMQRELRELLVASVSPLGFPPPASPQLRRRAAPGGSRPGLRVKGSAQLGPLGSRPGSAAGEFPGPFRPWPLCS